MSDEICYKHWGDQRSKPDCLLCVKLTYNRRVKELEAKLQHAKQDCQYVVEKLSAANATVAELEAKLAYRQHFIEELRNGDSATCLDRVEFLQLNRHFLPEGGK